MTQPQILVLAGTDAAQAIQDAGFMLAGGDDVRRQTPAVIIETRGEAGSKAGDLVRALRGALGPRAGLFFAWTDTTSQYDTSAFDGALDSGWDKRAIAARIQSSLRIAVMADEVRQRFASLEKFGGSARPPKIVTAQQSQILVYGAPSPHLLRYCSILESLGLGVVSCFTSFTAFDYLHTGSFDGIVVVDTDAATQANSFCHALGRNARLFHLPCQILANQIDEVSIASLSRVATDLSVIGEDELAAGTRLIDLIDEKRSRDAIALAFAAARAPAAIDPGTGLYAQAFFNHHLERLVGRARLTDRPLSLAVLRIAPDPMIEHLGKGLGLDRLVGQAGAMLSRLVRSEDVAARIDRTRFAVLFPASDQEGAMHAASRIASVLEWTAFDVGNDVTSHQNDGPVHIKLDFHCAELADHESHQQFLNTACARFA